MTGGLHLGIRLSARTSGGGRVFANELVHALSRHPSRADVTVFALGDASALDMPDQVRVVQVDSSRSALARRTKGAAAVVAAVRENPVDVLLCPGTELSKVDETPSLLWPLTVAPFEQETLRVLGNTPARRARWTLLREAVRIACKKADGLVFSSHYARALHTQAQPAVCALPTKVIHPAASLSVERSHPRPAALDDVDDPYMLFVSHLYPYKMVVELVEGFALSAADMAFRHHLVLAGDGVDAGYVRRIEATIARYSLQHRVHLLGSVNRSQLDGLYTHADSFVFPSISENAGSYALIDAFVYGLPVISSYLSSMPEICQGAARYFDPRDAESIASQLSRVASDKGIRNVLAQRSQEQARELPSWDTIADDFLSFGTRVAEQHR